MPSGGSGRGQGRPPTPFWRKVQVGIFCEERFQQEQEAQRWARFEARGDTHRRRQLQEQARTAAARAQRRFVALPPAELRKAIAKPAAELDKIGRVSAVPKVRPKGIRGRILREAADEYGCSPSVADKYWQLVRRLV
jgi:hypothetical protein